MCHDPTARPPLPPIAGASDDVRSEDLVLTSEDGTEFAALAATHPQPGGPGMVILPDVRGLHPFYQDLARRFAQAGIHAVALDYFGRTAGVGSGEARGAGFEFAPHVQQTLPDTVAQDVAAAVAFVRSSRGGDAQAVFTVGFCFGGRASFNQAARGHGLAGVMGFYGRPAPVDDNDSNAPIGHVPTFECPVLGLFGGADRGITSEDVRAFGRALDDAGLANELVIYDGAPHSFFDRAYEQFATECDDAWSRILRFVEENSKALVI
jgi:carboxymethylenebutenolidase